MLAAVVILYHPNITEVVSNVNTYIDYIDELYIIDNTENDKTFDEYKENKKVRYIKNGFNVGVAKALNIGAKLALENGHSYLLTMDQDSYFKDNDIQSLKDFYDHNIKNDIAILSPLQSSYLDDDSEFAGVDYPLTVITSGNIIDLTVWIKVGGFNEDYFIDGVDFDYCLKVKDAGYKIVRLNDIVLEHKLGNIQYKQNILGKSIVLHSHSPVRRYYMIRNGLRLSLKYIFKYPKFSLSNFKSICIELKCVILYEDNKKEKFKYMLKGLVDFLFGKYGKIDEVQ